jgi:phospholipase/carboxylesterase
MNRLAKYPFSKTKIHSTTPQTRFQPPITTPASYSPYHLMGPIGYEKNYAYPLLIWLHGPNDNEQQILNIMPHVSLRNYVAIGLRGNRHDAGKNAFTWSLQDSSLDRARQQVIDAIETASLRYNIHPERIFLGGLQSAGTVALRLALAEPELFGGVISIGGKFPTGTAALWRYQAAQSLPMLLMRGLESQEYPEAVFCDEIKLFHAARLRVHARQYLCGDEVNDLMLRDLNAWLMERVTGESLLEKLDSPTIC